MLCATLACGSASAAKPVVAWGDSLTAGSGGTPWPKQFNALSHVDVAIFGFGGKSSTDIKNLMLSDTLHNNDFAVIWVGRNNYYQNDTVVADVAAMVGHLTSTDYLILGVTNGSYGGYEVRGGDGWKFITELNTRLGSIYGPRFIDVRADLVAQYDPSSPQDALDFGTDTVPTSLRYDQGHLNTRGYGVVAQSVYAQYTALAAVPEPSRLALFALGCTALAAFARRRTHVPASRRAVP